MTQLRSIYFIAANTALLVWALQFTACVGLRAYDRFVPALLKPPMTEAVRQNYAHMSAQDQAELFAAARATRFRYEPVMGIMEQQMTSRFINVDAHGIRSNGGAGRGLATLDGAIWFLGGSTTFGDSIADHETIPAQLEAILKRPVVNLGVPGFSSDPENLLLNHYLRIGYRPSLVLFLDGVNEACEPYPYTREMSILFDRAQGQGYIWDLGGPLTHAYFRAVRKAKKLAGVWVEEGDRQSISCSHDGKQYPLATLHGRLMAERGAICRLYEIDCRTLVQPFAGTHGRSEDLPASFLAGDAKDMRDVFFHLEPGWRAAGATFVTDAFDGYNRHPFVDEVHYSADASRLLAETIAKRLNLVGPAAPAP